MLSPLIISSGNFFQIYFILSYITNFLRKIITFLHDSAPTFTQYSATQKVKSLYNNYFPAQDSTTGLSTRTPYSAAFSSIFLANSGF